MRVKTESDRRKETRPVNPNAAAPRVIIRHCDAYDAERIRTIVREGLRELGLVPRRAARW